MSFGFGSGLKALNAARLGIQTAGHNVSNANTPGFSRQRVMLASSMPFSFGAGYQIGTGVDITDISRIIDSSLNARLSLQSGMLAGADVEYTRLREIEGLFGEPDNGLSQDLAGLFGSIGQLQSDPADRALRGGVVQSATTLTNSLNMLSSRLQQVAAGSIGEVRALVGELNNKAHQLATINGQIGAIESTGGSVANDLRDQRDALVQEISEFADVRTLERASGSVDVLVGGGHLLVAGDRVSKLSVRQNTTGAPEIYGSDNRVALQSGRIGSLLTSGSAAIQSLTAQLDRLAQNFALEFNRAHSTGVPSSGPLHSLTANWGVGDTDHDGSHGDELLNATGLPFDIAAGELWVQITNEATGATQRTKIQIDPSSMTLNDLAAELGAIANLSASVDPVGRMRIQSAAGYGFDFSPQLDQSPNTFGAFGGTNPVLGSQQGGPFNLGGATFPQTFAVDVDGTVETVTLQAADFANASSATAEELAAAINDDLTGSTAAVAGGRILIRSNASGAGTQLTLSDGAGSPLAALGMPTGPASGQARGVQVAISGEYTGTTNGNLTFVPDADGTIGVTPGLTVGAYDQNGRRVATLDVGSSYKGDSIEVTDGVKVSFSQGAISASSNQAFALDTLADSDTSDVLAALGINTMFSGFTAGTIEVAQALRDDPDLLAAGLSGASGDGSNLERLTALRDQALNTLNSASFESFYGEVVSDLGFEVAAAETMVQAESSLMASLQQQRDSISGVNIDEEMVDIVKHQQAYEAAARFISTVQEMTSTLINLGR